MVSGIMSISWPDNDMCSKLESEFLTSAFILQKLPLSYLVYTIRLESWFVQMVTCHMWSGSDRPFLLGR